MTDKEIQASILRNLCEFQKHATRIVIIHGGGPFIKAALAKANIISHFHQGQRVTSAEALTHIETSLKGQVNSQLVGQLNGFGQKAVGLSGKDGKMVIARKRYGKPDRPGDEPVDIGFVGEVNRVQTELLEWLLHKGYLPVVTCLGTDEEGRTYNINADNFAGAIAGALQAEELIVLTDVDGLLRDVNKPTSLISELNTTEIDALIDEGIVTGGMIPKVESCRYALERGTKQVRMLNGTKPEQLQLLLNGAAVGTLIKN